MKLTKITLAVLLSLFGLSLFGQCEYDLNIEYLHVNNIRAAILNQGDNFWDRNDARFEVPYEGPESPSTIFASNIWVAVKNPSDKILLSAGTYYSRTTCGMTPGPIERGEQIAPQDRANLWNKIFTVHGQDILDHIEDAQDGRIDVERPGIFGWPGIGNNYFMKYHGTEVVDSRQGMAEFMEVPGHENGIYEPELGEYPHVGGLAPDAIPGAIYWTVYNTGGQGAIDGISPILEIQQTAWAMSCEDETLSNTIFMRYKIINRDSGDYTGFRFGLWSDPDLGCYTDDYVGCDPGLNAYYIYNNDNEDDDNCFNRIAGYGINPPVQTIKFLNTNLDGFSIYANKGIPNTPPEIGDPDTFDEYYNYLSSKWADGTPFTRGGNGYNPGSTDTTRFMFTDHPKDNTGWSMLTENISEMDIRAIMTNRSEISGGAFDQGAIFIYDLAYSYFRAPGLDHVGNVDYALTRLPLLQFEYDSGFEGCGLAKSNCESVWPGDTDNNGRVDYLDAVNVFKAMGNTGTERNGPLAWIGNSVPDWASSIPGSVNSKHADINGDGEIAVDEISYLEGFLGRRNNCEIPEAENCLYGNEVYIPHSRDSIFGTRLPLDPVNVYLRSKNTFWGYSFRLKYDTDLFDLLNIRDVQRWSDPLSTTLFHTVKEIDRPAHGVVSFNGQKEDRTLKNTSDNEIVSFIVHQLDVPNLYHQPYAEVEICDFVVYYEDGSEEQLPSKSLKYWMPDSVVITSNRSVATNRQLSVFPNPGIDQLSLNWESEPANMSIFSSEGQLVTTYPVTRGTNTFELGHLPPGVFILSIRSEQYIYTGRWVKLE